MNHRVIVIAVLLSAGVLVGMTASPDEGMSQKLLK